MRPVILLALALSFAAAAGSKGAVDLTPTPSEYTAEGITYKRLVFQDGNRRISYEPPRQWIYRLVGESLRLAPSAETTAEATIQAIPLRSQQDLDDNSIAAIKEHFSRNIPPGSLGVTMLAGQEHAVPVKAPNYEVSASYQALGDTFVRRALYVNLPDTQLVFRFTARKSEFDVLYRLFRASILSWEWNTAPSAATSVSPAAVVAQSQTTTAAN